MTLRERLASAASAEGGIIFTLGFIAGFPHYFYADLGWQLAEGRALWGGSFPTRLPEAIAAGPWIDHEWLFEALAWPFWAHAAWPVFAALCTALVATVPLLAVAIARRCGASPFVANACGYLTIASAVTSYAPRPQTIAELCFALELLLLLGPLRRPWLALPLAALWANVHGSVVLAPLLAAIVAAGHWIESGQPSRKLIEAALWSLAGTLLSPLGIETWTSAAQFASRSDIIATSDWQPVSFSYPVEFFVLVTCGAALVAGGVPIVRRNATALGLLGIFTALWLLEARFLPFFGIAAVPAIAIALERSGWETRRRRAARTTRVAGGWLGLPLVVAVVATVLLRAPSSLQVDRDVLATDALVRTSGFAGRLFAPFTAGGYLELRGEPVAVLLDTHALPFGPQAWRDYATIDAARSGWQSALARNAIAGVVAADDGPLAAALRADPHWRIAASVDGQLLFTRRSRALQAPGSRAG
jgi:hypothetical protein